MNTPDDFFSQHDEWHNQFIQQQRQAEPTGRSQIRYGWLVACLLILLSLGSISIPAQLSAAESQDTPPVSSTSTTETSDLDKAEHEEN